MRKILKKGTIENNFFRDYWNYIQEYAIIEDTDKYWENISIDGNKLINKYNKNNFVRNLISSYIVEQDKINKEDKYK